MLWDELNHTVRPGGSRKNRDENQKYSLAFGLAIRVMCAKIGPSLGHAHYMHEIFMGRLWDRHNVG